LAYCFPVTIIGNQITVPTVGMTGDPIPIYIGATERVIATSNQIRTANAYPHIVVSASGADTLISGNQYANAGAKPVIDAGTGTYWLKPSNVAMTDKANVFTEKQTGTKSVQHFQPMLFEQIWDDNTVGPLVTVRRKSASPSANDLGGAFQFQFQNSLGANFNGGYIVSYMLDPTAGSEDAGFKFQTKSDGLTVDRGFVYQGFVFGSPVGGDKGPGTLNATEIYANNIALGAAVADLTARIEALEMP